MSNMKDKSRRGHSKKKKERKDYFPVFKSVTYDAFDYLVRDYGFKHVETFVSLPECFIKYRNNTTYVTIAYELDSGILVSAGRLKHTPEIIESEWYDLDHLITTRCPDREINQKGGGWTDERIEFVVRSYARVLSDCGKDLLNGDFSVFPTLKRLQEERIRKLNLKLFGSETGETVR